MITEYERELTSKERQKLKDQVPRYKSLIIRTLGFLLLKIVVLTLFVLFAYMLEMLWLTILLSVIGFFVAWYVKLEIEDLFRFPKMIRSAQEAAANGVARVTQIELNNYIKINNYEDEGNHFIIEHQGMLNMIGGQDFFNVRTLKNELIKTEILNADKDQVFFETIKKNGTTITPYYTFKNGISDALVQSEVWKQLTDRVPFKGVLSDLDPFIEQDKKTHKS